MITLIQIENEIAELSDRDAQTKHGLKTMPIAIQIDGRVRYAQSISVRESDSGEPLILISEVSPQDTIRLK